jgi:acetyltransferase
MSFNTPKYGVLDYFLGTGAKDQVAESIEEAIAKNKPAVLLTGPGPIPDELLQQARDKGIAILGPDSYGVAAPHEGINRCLSLSPIAPGRVAFVTQSGALGAAILDWAHQHHFGFSKFIALGESPTIRLGECIDYLAEDPHTHSILLYLESIPDAGQFLSAARECALQKPIIVLKPGRGDGKKDSIYDAAFRRCGILRVSRMADLFYMADVLERQPRPKGAKLAILTNANGPALLAADALRQAGGELHSLVDLGGGAKAAQYLSGFEALASDENCHGILLIVTPQPDTEVTQTARVIAAAASKCRKTVLASLIGGKLMAGGEVVLSEARVPTFPYADTAAKVFQRIWQYSRSLNGLYETPMFSAEVEDTTAIRAELEQSSGALSAAMLNRLLMAYGIHKSPGQSETSIGFLLESRPDASFGPVLHLEAGGLGGVIYEDRVASLPPLTSTLARRALELLQLHRACSAEALQALEELLVRVSRLVSDFAVVREWRLQVQVEADGTIWVNEASATLQPEGLAKELWPRCVIRPYPQQYVKTIALRDGRQATLRPIRPEDELRIVDFHNDLSERSVYLRYLQFLKFEERIEHDRLARVCFNDYARELALVVEQDDRILGVGRLQRNPLRMEEAEVAFLVRDSAQGQGIGSGLVENLIAAARAEGLLRLTAEMHVENRPMRKLLERAGFRSKLAMDGQTVLARLALTEA